MPYVGVFAALSLALALALGFLPAWSTCCADFTFDEQPSKVVVRLDGVAVASFVYDDAAVGRPYWCDVRSPSGIPLTRSHPPQAPDDLDHVAMHTGLWMSFGDLSGCDYWRCKARTQQVRFLESPASHGKTGGFSVLNHYLKTDSSEVLATEKADYQFCEVPHGYRLQWSSEFRAIDKDIVFGDQEEMGLGVRMVSSLAEKRGQGGRILDSDNRVGAKQVWGEPVEWCDSSGRIHGRWIGITLMADPDNFQVSWCHARDYGLIVMNPFGRKAFSKGEESRLIVSRANPLRLNYALVFHESNSNEDYHEPDAYRDFLKQILQRQRK